MAIIDFLVQILGIAAIAQVARCQPPTDPNGFWGVFDTGCTMSTNIGAIGLYDFEDCQTFANQADTFTGPSHAFNGVDGEIDCWQENLGNCAVFWCHNIENPNVPSGNDLSAAMESIFFFGSESGAKANCIGMAHFDGSTIPAQTTLLCLGDTTTANALLFVSRQYNSDVDSEFACGACGNPDAITCP